MTPVFKRWQRLQYVDRRRPIEHRIIVEDRAVAESEDTSE